MKLGRPSCAPGLLVVAGPVQTIERPKVSRLVNIGTSEELSAPTLARRVKAIAELGRVEHGAQRLPQTYREVVDWRRAREDLGWEPAISLEEGLRRVWYWWCQRCDASGPGEPTEVGQHASQGRP
jgi:nucleoside-diphosphate-sugar epimerase